MYIVGYVARMGEMTTVCGILVGKPEAKKPLPKPLRNVGWDGMNWANLVQDRDQWRDLAKTVTNILTKLILWS
jgi:hypothetical protein